MAEAEKATTQTCGRRKGGRNHNRDDKGKQKICLDDLLKDGKTMTFFAGNITYASKKAKSYIYNLNGDVVSASGTHLGRAATSWWLKAMRKKGKWVAMGSCGHKIAGHSGLSAGMMMAARKGINAMFPGVDSEGF